MNIRPDTPVSTEDLQAASAAYATKSDQMRALARKGYARARIADALGVKYQFVRNVLEDDARLGRRRPPPPAGLAETPPPSFTVSRSGKVFRLTLENDGSLRIPPQVLEALNLSPCGLVISVLEGETFSLLSPREAGERARAHIRPWREGEPLLSEELIKERRAEARREDAE